MKRMRYAASRTPFSRRCSSLVSFARADSSITNVRLDVSQRHACQVADNSYTVGRAWMNIRQPSDDSVAMLRGVESRRT